MSTPTYAEVEEAALAHYGIVKVSYLKYEILVHRDDFFVIAPDGTELGQTTSMARARLWVRQHRRENAL